MPNPILTIVHASDVHISPERPEFTANFLAVAEYTRRIKPDIALITGDLVENIKEDEYRFFNKNVRAFKRTVWHLPGNHDIGNKRSIAAGRVSVKQLASYRRIIGADFWHRRKKGVHFVAFNSVILESGFPEDKKQREWLVKTLSRIPHGEKIILCTHYPLFIERPDETAEKTKYWTIDSPAREELLALLTKHDIIAYLCGHRHIPYVNHYGNTVCVIAPSSAFSLGPVREDVALNVVRVYQDRIDVETIPVASIK